VGTVITIIFGLITGVLAAWWITIVIVLRLGRGSYSTRREYVQVSRAFLSIRGGIIGGIMNSPYILLPASLLALGLGASQGDMLTIAGGAACLMIGAGLFWLRLRLS